MHPLMLSDATSSGWLAWRLVLQVFRRTPVRALEAAHEAYRDDR